jgi:hypothetical protein
MNLSDSIPDGPASWLHPVPALRSLVGDQQLRVVSCPAAWLSGSEAGMEGLQGITRIAGVKIVEGDRPKAERRGDTGVSGGFFGEYRLKGWLPDMDLNHDKQIQNLLCYRYTIGQSIGARN